MPRSSCSAYDVLAESATADALTMPASSAPKPYSGTPAQCAVWRAWGVRSVRRAARSVEPLYDVLERCSASAGGSKCLSVSKLSASVPGLGA